MGRHGDQSLSSDTFRVKTKPWYREGRSIRLMVFGSLLFVFCLAELAVGVFVHSLALVTDAVHLLSDVVALAVGLLAIKYARTPASEKYSYGLKGLISCRIFKEIFAIVWIRFETLGGMANSCFLIALCLFILLEAVQRFIEYNVVKDTMLVVYVGCGGFVLNLFGIFLFWSAGEHGHSHAGGSGHGHSHGGKSKSKSNVLKVSSDPISLVDSEGDEEDEAGNHHGHSHSSHGHSHSGGSHNHSHQGESAGHHGDHDEHDDHSDDHDHGHQGAHSHSQNQKGAAHNHSHSSSHGHAHSAPKKIKFSNLVRVGPADAEEIEITPKRRRFGNGDDDDDDGVVVKHQNLNMKAVFLHVIGDFLGSIGVITSGLLETYLTWEFRFYVDPIVSVVIALIIVSSAVPILISCGKILIGSIPSEMSSSFVKRRLVSIPGVKSVHELHIWQLHESKVIASVHVVTEQPQSQLPQSDRESPLLDEIKGALHRLGIHSSTVQLEGPLRSLNGGGNGEEISRARDLEHTGSVCGDIVCRYDCSESWCCEKED